MGEAKRRKQNDPNYGTTPKLRKTQEMLKPLKRSEVEELTECLGHLLGRVLTDASNFIGDCEASGNWGIDLSARFPSYCALKQTTEDAIDWLEGE